MPSRESQHGVQPQVSLIYLETSILRESEWPHVSVRLEQLLSLAKNLGVQVFLPEPVDCEREEQWLRDFSKSATEQKKVWLSIEQQLSNIGVQINSGDFPTGIQLRESYRLSVGALKKNWSIFDAPYTSRKLTDLFLLAARHQIPFGDEGRGFQDAVIYLSVVDHLAGFKEGISAILVSSDKGYDSISMALVAPDIKDLDLTIARLDGATEILKSHLEESVRRHWDVLQNKAKKKLQEMRQNLETFFLANISPDQLPVFGNVAHVYQIEVANIINVRTPDPRELNSGEEFEISADLSLRVSAAVTDISAVSYAWTKGDLLVGTPSNLNQSNNHTISMRRFEISVELQSLAVLHDEEFDSITPIAATVNPMGSSSLWASNELIANSAVYLTPPIVFGPKPKR